MIEATKTAMRVLDTLNQLRGELSALAKDEPDIAQLGTLALFDEALNRAGETITSSLADATLRYRQSRQGNTTNTADDEANAS